MPRKGSPSKIDPADQQVADIEKQLEEWASDDRRQLIEELVAKGYATRDDGADDGVRFTNILGALQELDSRWMVLDGEMASVLTLRDNLTGLVNPRVAPNKEKGQVKFTLVDIANTPFAKKDSKLYFMANIAQMIVDLDKKIASLTTARNALAEANGIGAKRAGAKPKRTMSAEGRAKIAAAQKKRWALVNKAKSAPKKKAVAKKAAAVEGKA